MLYLLKTAKEVAVVIIAFECAFPPSDRFHPTDLLEFLFPNSERKHLCQTLILESVENGTHQGTQKSVLVHKTSLC